CDQGRAQTVSRASRSQGSGRAAPGPHVRSRRHDRSVSVRTLVVAVALVAAAPPARAEEMLRPDQIPEKARVLAEGGRHYHDAGDYEQAIAAFKEAYVLAPSPGLLFNLAQAYRLAGQCDDAAWMYRRYLDASPAADRRAIAENHLAIVEKCGHGTFK